MRGAWAFGSIVVAFAAVGLASGQTAGEVFAIELPRFSYALLDEPMSLAPGECDSMRALVVNTGNTSAKLRIAGVQLTTRDAEPDGTMSPVAFRAVPSTLDLAPNASAEIALHACAFEYASEGESNISLELISFPPGAPVGSIPVTVTVVGAPAEITLPAPWWWGLAAAGGAVAAWLSLRRVEWLKYAALGSLAPLYTRLAPSRLLEQEKREAIYRLIEQEPGIHFSALLMQTALPNGVLVHHLRQLERHKLVVSRREGALRRFAAAPAEFPPLAPRPLTPMQSRVMHLLSVGPLTQREIATALGLTQQGANRHVKALERRGLLAIRYQDGEWRCHATTPALQS